MAVIWMDGPDHYGSGAGGVTRMLDGVYADAGFMTLLPNAGPGGLGTVFSFAGLGSLNPGFFRKVLPGGRGTVAIGLRWFASSLPNSNRQWRAYEWRDAGNAALGTLWITSTGAFEYVRASDNAVLLTTGPLVTANSWRHIEAKVVFSATVGIIQINVDGIEVANVNTLNTGATLCAQVRVGSGDGNYSPIARDFYIWDETGTVNNSGMQGDRQIITSYPSADGPLQQWTPSTGVTGYNILAQVPPVDAQYVESLSAGNVSNYAMTDIDTDITSISAVRVAARAFKSDAGIGTFKMQLLSGVSIASSPETALSTIPTYYSFISELDPATGVKWTVTNLNAVLGQLRREQ